jgi:hypothetical protein
MSNQTTCPICKKTYDVLPKSNEALPSCPRCNQPNNGELPEIKKDRVGNVQLGVGLLFYLAGILAGTIGTLLCFIGVAFASLTRRPFQLGQSLTAAWFCGCLTLFCSGAWLKRHKIQWGPGKSVWEPWVMLVGTILAGLCTWIFVFGVCSGAFGR